MSSPQPNDESRHQLYADLDMPDDRRRAPVIRTGERPPISRLTRQMVYKRDGWRCVRCSASPYHRVSTRRCGPLHMDHIIPWSAGGSDLSDNLRTLCEECNVERSNYVRDSDEPATPIVRLCIPCAPPLTQDKVIALGRARIDVYCAAHHHFSWSVEGARIL